MAASTSWCVPLCLLYNDIWLPGVVEIHTVGVRGDSTNGTIDAFFNDVWYVHGWVVGQDQLGKSFPIPVLLG